MMFSDNVSIVQEKSIKTLARERQRIVMGPDCGTAIVNGIPLGFANVVKRGAIGVIGASGTGLQEVTCRIDQLGRVFLRRWEQADMISVKRLVEYRCSSL